MVDNYEMYTRYLKISNTINKLVKDEILDQYDYIDFATPHGDINFFVLGKIFDFKAIVDTNLQTYERMFNNDTKAKNIKKSNPFSKHLYDNLLMFSFIYDKDGGHFMSYLHFLYRYLGIDDSGIKYNYYRYKWIEEVAKEIEHKESQYW